ncbi:MAG: GGDEF domain-containing protein [Alphaproteobacteria bacterium]|nr:GGDEF domain-containing protein [Alphaproteobacteria bacterium]
MAPERLEEADQVETGSEALGGENGRAAAGESRGQAVRVTRRPYRPGGGAAAGRCRRWAKPAAAGKPSFNDATVVSFDAELRRRLRRRTTGRFARVRRTGYVSGTGLQKVKATAMAVIDDLATRKVPATPTNYSVWYAHVTGENPALSRRIRDHLGNNHPLSDEVLDELWRRHCSPMGDPATVAQASDRLGRVLSELGREMSAAGEDAGRYSDAIRNFGESVVKAFAAPDAASLLQDATRAMLLETKRMAEQNRSLESKLQSAGGEIDTLRRDLEEMRREAFTDPLTGVGNRKTFDRVLAEAMASARETAKPLTLVMIDIDHFKKFNDAHGHVLGDEVLKIVARTLVASVKGRDTVARYGGEEFGVILPETSLGNGYKVADQLREAVKAKKIVIRSTGTDLGRVTLSLGTAVYRAGEAATSFVKRADTALYFAKRNGRDRVADENDVQDILPSSAA